MLQLQADLSGALSAGLARMQVSAGTAQIERLLLWLQLLARWNRAFNLTAIPGARYIEQLVLPSAGAIPYLRPGNVADVGSGAGVPGVALAILAPENDYTLIDSNGKKTRFLKQCQMEIGLDNVSVARTRVEHLDGAVFDTIISRGFASLAEFLDLTRHLSHPNTRWLALKGGGVADDLQHLSPDKAKWQLHPLQVPGVKHPFSLVVMQGKQPVAHG